MDNLNLRAARIQLYGLFAALALALLISLGITTGAFVLSFSVLQDLAGQGLLPAKYTWIFPAIVDGAILGATISVVLLNKLSGNSKGRNFFVALLVGVVSISVVGNAYHAHQAAEAAALEIAAGIDLGFTPLAPEGAALIAVIPPVLVLLFTHGIGILIKAIGTAYTEYNELVDAAAPPHALQESIAQVISTVAPTVARGAKCELDQVAEGTEIAGERVTESGDMVTSEQDAVAVASDVAHDVDATQVDVELREVITPGCSPSAMPLTDIVDDKSKDSPEQTVSALLAFIDAAPGLDEVVRETARLKIIDDLSFAAIAERTDAKAASTAMRRYRKAECAALAAGFMIPPLPDVRESSAEVEQRTPHDGSMTLVAQ